MASLENLLSCESCHDLLVRPVRLQCDSLICEEHLARLSDVDSCFECVCCGQSHKKPPSGFQVDTTIEQIKVQSRKTAIEC